MKNIIISICTSIGKIMEQEMDLILFISKNNIEYIIKINKNIIDILFINEHKIIDGLSIDFSGVHYDEIFNILNSLP